MDMTFKNVERARRNVVGDWIGMSSRKWPQKTALIYKNGSLYNRISYNEVNEKANRVANGMLAMGIKKGDVVAILSHNCPQYVYFMWAAAKIGAIITTLNFNYGAREIEEQISDCDAKMLFVEDSLMGEVMEVRDKLSSVRLFGFINLTGQEMPSEWINFDELYSYPDATPEIDQTGEDKVAILYTTGTTGRGKGCVHTNNSIYAAWQNVQSPYGWYITYEDIGYVPTPLFTSTGYFMTILGPLKSGATMVLTYLPDPREILELIEKERCTLIALPPTLWISLSNQPYQNYDFTSVKKVMWFGDSMNLKVWQKILGVLPKEVIFSPGCSLTETGINGFSYFSREFPRRGTLIGLPHRNIEVRLVDDNDEDVPQGEPGEVVMRGPSIMKGYYQRDKENEVAFRNGWFHTGDIAIHDKDGLYYFFDRKKDMVKTGGFNVSCKEVEGVLNAHPMVQQSAVFGIPHPYWREAVTAAVVSKSEDLTEEELLQQCKSSLAAYKVPKRIILVSELPTNPFGKVVKAVLREKYKSVYQQNE
jgi:fatty-acyl-CoA synthase